MPPLHVTVPRLPNASPAHSTDFFFPCLATALCCQVTIGFYHPARTTKVPSGDSSALSIAQDRPRLMRLQPWPAGTLGISAKATRPDLHPPAGDRGLAPSATTWWPARRLYAGVQGHRAPARQSLPALSRIREHKALQVLLVHGNAGIPASRARARPCHTHIPSSLIGCLAGDGATPTRLGVLPGLRQPAQRPRLRQMMCQKPQRSRQLSHTRFLRSTPSLSTNETKGPNRRSSENFFVTPLLSRLVRHILDRYDRRTVPTLPDSRLPPPLWQITAQVKRTWQIALVDVSHQAVAHGGLHIATGLKAASAANVRQAVAHSWDERVTPADAWARSHHRVDLWADKTVRFFNPCTKLGICLRETPKRLLDGFKAEIPDLQACIHPILTKQAFSNPPPVPWGWDWG